MGKIGISRKETVVRGYYRVLKGFYIGDSKSGFMSTV
jgi:hypothetical protein